MCVCVYIVSSISSGRRQGHYCVCLTGSTTVTLGRLHKSPWFSQHISLVINEDPPQHRNSAGWRKGRDLLMLKFTTPTQKSHVVILFFFKLLRLSRNWQETISKSDAFREDKAYREVFSAELLINYPSLSLSYLHLLHHLLTKGADFGGRGDNRVLGALVLTWNAIEGVAVILQINTKVRLKEEKKTAGSSNRNLSWCLCEGATCSSDISIILYVCLFQ